MSCLDKLCCCLDYKEVKQQEEPAKEQIDEQQRVDTDRKMLDGNTEQNEQEANQDGGMEPKNPSIALTALVATVNERVIEEVKIAEEDGGSQLRNHDLMMAMKEKKLKQTGEEDLKEDRRIREYSYFHALCYDLKETSHLAQVYNFFMIWRRVIFVLTAMYVLKAFV